jgi:deoxycytidylate deaminase
MKDILASRTDRVTTQGRKIFHFFLASQSWLIQHRGLSVPTDATARRMHRVSVAEHGKATCEQAVAIAADEQHPANLLTNAGEFAVSYRQEAKYAKNQASLRLSRLLRMEKHGDVVTEDSRYHLIEHAERSAIFVAVNASENLSGATIDCTRSPCSDCVRAIVWAGIKRPLFAGGFGGEQRWLEYQRAALNILRDSGVTIRYLSP